MVDYTVAEACFRPFNRVPLESYSSITGGTGLFFERTDESLQDLLKQMCELFTENSMHGCKGTKVMLKRKGIPR
jgi:hypothetical protein